MFMYSNCLLLKLFRYQRPSLGLDTILPRLLFQLDLCNIYMLIAFSPEDNSSIDTVFYCKILEI